MRDITYTKLKCLGFNEFEDISKEIEAPYKTRYRFKLGREMIYLELYTYIYTTHLDVFFVRQARLEKYRSFSEFKEFLSYLDIFLHFKPDPNFERIVFIEENLQEFI